MPHSTEHEQRKVKNYLLLIIMLLIVAVSFAVTIVKMKTASDQAAEKNLTTKAEEGSEKPADASTN